MIINPDGSVDYSSLNEVEALTLSYYTPAVLAERSRSAIHDLKTIPWHHPSISSENLEKRVDSFLKAFRGREIFANLEYVDNPIVELTGSLWDRVRELETYCTAAEAAEVILQAEKLAERDRLRAEKAARKQAEAQARRRGAGK